MFHRVRAIALNTFRESSRDRILLAVALFSLVMIAFSVFIGSISLEQDKKIIEDFGLAFIFLLEVFVAVFVGSNLMYKEIERKTFFLIIPKPVSRSEIILGKFLGLGLTNLFVTICSSVVFFLLVILKTHASGDVPYLLSAIVLGYVETLIITLISILFSGLTSPLLSALYTTTLFLIGHSSSILVSVIQAQHSAVTQYVLYFFYYIFPNFEKYNIRNEAIYGVYPPRAEVGLSLLYAVLYGVFLFIIARAIFERRQY